MGVAYKEEIGITRTMSKANTRTALTGTFGNVCIPYRVSLCREVPSTRIVEILNSPHWETDIFWTRNQHNVQLFHNLFSQLIHTKRNITSSASQTHS